MPRIGIVGPCCAGKSTLAQALNTLGYAARPIAQEHSYVPHMWQIISHPEVLIFLDVSYPVAQQRRRMNWQLADLEEQHRRLSHARAHCHFYLHTDALTCAEVRTQVETFLKRIGQPPPLAL